MDGVRSRKAGRQWRWVNRHPPGWQLGSQVHNLVLDGGQVPWEFVDLILNRRQAARNRLVSQTVPAGRVEVL